LVRSSHYTANRRAASYNWIRLLSRRHFVATPLFLQLITFILQKEGASYPKLIAKRNPALKELLIFLWKMA